MKNILKISTLIIILGTCTACNKFLDKKAPASLTTENFFSKEEDAFASVVAAYSDLKDPRYTNGIFEIGDVLSDGSTQGGDSNDQANMARMEIFQYHPDNPIIENFWRAIYRGLNKVNQAIDGISKMDESLFKTYNKNQLLAEAKFLRAYFHFEAVKTWGDVPLISKTPTMEDKNTMVRSPKDAVYKLIEEDLDFCKILPRKTKQASKDYGHPSSDAAYALLARVYLYQKKYPQAKVAAYEVIKLAQAGEYGLMTNFGDIWDIENEWCKESIYEINFFHSTTTTGQYTANGNISATYVGALCVGGWGLNTPLSILNDGFESSDKRRDYTILDKNTIIKNETPAIANAWNPGLTGFFNYKYYVKPAHRSASWTRQPNNIRLLRLSDVYLMYAEACAKSEDIVGAKTYLNEVRNRAGLNGTTANTAEELYNAVIEERRLEFAMEGHRFYDLARTGKAAEAFASPAVQAIPQKRGAAFVTGKHEILPIPQSEVSASNGRITQNIY